MPASPSPLPLDRIFSLLTWIDTLSDEFEALWRSGARPSLREFIAPAPADRRLPLLRELVRIDLEWRSRLGEDAREDDYLADFPELADSDDDVFTPETAAIDPPEGAADEFPHSIGHFRIIELLGRGGFGDVFKAVDTRLGRTVAIKVPRRHVIAEPALHERFVREARNAARLKHPNIVEVFDVVEIDSVPCIVASFVEGQTLSEYCKSRPLSDAAIATLTATVAEALDYAHGMKLIHRDVTPRNILVDSNGVPHVTDFGLARCEGTESSLTVEGQVVGTAPYISPEQAAGKSHEADARTDVYGLGVVLYLILTGEKPFPEEGPILYHRILNDEPRPPRKLRPSIPPDLEAVCLKAMAKNPRERYATAREFADDLRSFHRGESVIARRPNLAVRGYRWCHRNRWVAGAAAALLVALCSIIGLLLQGRHLGLHRERMLLRESYVQKSERTRLTRPRDNAWSKRAWALIEKAAEIERGPDLQGHAVACLTGLDAIELFRYPEIEASSVAFTGDGEQLFLAAHDKEGKNHRVAMLPRDGACKEVVSAAAKLVLARREDGGGARLVWKDGRPFVLDASASADGFDDAPGPDRRLATLSHGARFAGWVHGNRVESVDLKDGKSVEYVSADATALAHSSDGSIAVGDNDGNVRIYSRRQKEPTKEFRAGRSNVLCLVFSNDGAWLASGGFMGELTLLRRETGETKRLLGSSYDVTTFAFSDDGTLLATGGRGAVRIFDTATGNSLLEVQGGDYAQSVAFSPQTDRLVTSTQKHGVSVFHLRNGPAIRSLRGLDGLVNQIHISPDDSLVAALAQNGKIGVWSLATGNLLALLDGPRCRFPDNAAVAFGPAGQLVVSAGKEAKMWNLHGGVKSWKFEHEGLAEILAFRDADHLYHFRMEKRAGLRKGVIRNLLAANPLASLHELDDFNQGVMSRGPTLLGKHFTIAGNYEDETGVHTHVKAVDPATGQVIWNLRSSFRCTSVPYADDPAGEFLSLGTLEDHLPAQLLDARTGESLGVYSKNISAVGPDAKHMLFSAVPVPSATHEVPILYEANSMKPLLVFSLDNPPAGRVIFSHDGRRILWGDGDGGVCVGSLEDIRAELQRLGLGW